MSAPNLRQQWRDAIRDADDPAIDVYTIAVAFALDRHMSADGRTFTGRRLLGQLARVATPATIQKRLEWFVEAGWLEREWAGRGHKAHYQVVLPTNHLGVGSPTNQPPEVVRPSTEVVRGNNESGSSHEPDPDTTPTTPKGGGVGGAAKAAAGAAPPSRVGDGPAGEATTGWIVAVLTELGFDPDDIDIHDSKLIDASAPLTGRRPFEIRNALGRQPKGLRERLHSPARFVATKLTELHALPDNDPRWKRPDKPKKESAPSTNGDTSNDWRSVHDRFYEPVYEKLDALDAEEFWESDEGDATDCLLVVAFDDELNRVAGYWDQPKDEPFTRSQMFEIEVLCRHIDGAPEGRFSWSDRFLQVFRARERLPKCRLCDKRLAGEVPVIDGAHDFCVGAPCPKCGQQIREDQWNRIVDGQRVHSSCPEPAVADNVTDITASDTHQRGVAKARAALSGATDDLFGDLEAARAAAFNGDEKW